MDSNLNIKSNQNQNNTDINIYDSENIEPQFDFYKDFEIKESIQKNKSNSKNEHNNELNIIINSFPTINDNLRTNILFSVEIYKKIKNFDIDYIHDVINKHNKK